MSDSYQITLGIGTPASIARFTLFGLHPRLVGVIPLTVGARDLALTADGRSIGLDLIARDLALTAEDRPE